MARKQETNMEKVIRLLRAEDVPFEYKTHNEMGQSLKLPLGGLGSHHLTVSSPKPYANVRLVAYVYSHSGSLDELSQTIVASAPRVTDWLHGLAYDVQLTVRSYDGPREEGTKGRHDLVLSATLRRDGPDDVVKEVLRYRDMTTEELQRVFRTL